MDRIGIDIDSTNVFRLIKTYFHVKRVFDKDIEKIITEVSSSGRGYHILIYLKDVDLEPTQNFFFRALFGDCPHRLELSMEKYYINPREKWADLIFSEKNEEYVIAFGLEELLKPHSVTTNQIMVNWGTPEIDKLIENLADMIKDKIPTKPTYVTVFAFRTDTLREKLHQVCKDIYMKDITFEWRIYDSYYPDTDFILSVFSPTRDMAFKRGDWILYKTLTEEDKQRVKKFGKDKYFWVKTKEKK